MGDERDIPLTSEDNVVSNEFTLNKASDRPNTSFLASVNDMSGEKAKVNCYLTALVGNSRFYQKLGVKEFAKRFNIEVKDGGMTIEELKILYTRESLGQEGYKPCSEYLTKDALFKELNIACTGVNKKFILIYFQRANNTFFGHAVSVKAILNNSRSTNYWVIDYQVKSDKRVYEKSKTITLPLNAIAPFYLFEKKTYL